MKTFEQHMNGQELRIPRSLAGAGGTQKTADAEKGRSTEKTNKQRASTNAYNL